MRQRLTAWANWDEWKGVKEALYSDDPSDTSTLQAAIDRIAAWRARARLPIAVEGTESLVRVQLSDASGSTTEWELRLMYSMTIVRLVNGLVDAESPWGRQRSVARVAHDIGLPQIFVDLRHDATHKELPSLASLRYAHTQAIEWLYDHYWQPQEDALSKTVEVLRRALSRYANRRLVETKYVTPAAASNKGSSERGKSERSRRGSASSGDGLDFGGGSGVDGGGVSGGESEGGGSGAGAEDDADTGANVTRVRQDSLDSNASGSELTTTAAAAATTTTDAVGTEKKKSKAYRKRAITVSRQLSGGSALAEALLANELFVPTSPVQRDQLWGLWAPLLADAGEVFSDFGTELVEQAISALCDEVKDVPALGIPASIRLRLDHIASWIQLFLGSRDVSVQRSLRARIRLVRDVSVVDLARECAAAPSQWTALALTSLKEAAKDESETALLDTLLRAQDLYGEAALAQWLAVHAKRMKRRGGKGSGSQPTNSTPGRSYRELEASLYELLSQQSAENTATTATAPAPPVPNPDRGEGVSGPAASAGAWSLVTDYPDVALGLLPDGTLPELSLPASLNATVAADRKRRRSMDRLEDYSRVKRARPNVSQQDGSATRVGGLGEEVLANVQVELLF